jgi:hypothetical protein
VDQALWSLVIFCSTFFANFPGTRLQPRPSHQRVRISENSNSGSMSSGKRIALDVEPFRVEWTRQWLVQPIAIKH